MGARTRGEIVARLHSERNERDRASLEIEFKEPRVDRGS